MNPDKMRWNVTEKTETEMKPQGQVSRKMGEDVGKF